MQWGDDDDDDDDDVSVDASLMMRSFKRVTSFRVCFLGACFSYSKHARVVCLGPPTDRSERRTRPRDRLVDVHASVVVGAAELLARPGLLLWLAG